MLEGEHVPAELYGMWPPGQPFPPGLQVDLGTGRIPAELRTAQTVQVRDARRLCEGLAPDEAFARHGVALLANTTHARSWDAEAEPGTPIPAARQWFAEIEQLATDVLFPSRTVEVEASAPFTYLHRRPDMPAPYAGAVHCDHGRTTGDYQQTLSAFTSREVGRSWRGQFDRPSVTEFLVIGFWRTAGMTEPLLDMPLALCLPGSVRPGDATVIDWAGIAPHQAITRQGLLRHDPGQRWCYFPSLAPDECLAFQQLRLTKEHRATADFPGCFHSAFRDPKVPDGAPPRRSAEMRVGVFVHRADTERRA